MGERDDDKPLVLGKQALSLMARATVIEVCERTIQNAPMFVGLSEAEVEKLLWSILPNAPQVQQVEKVSHPPGIATLGVRR